MIKKREINDAVLTIPKPKSFGVSKEEFIKHIAIAAGMADYEFISFKTDKKEFCKSTLLLDGGITITDDFKKSIRSAKIITESVNHARHLVDMPGNVVHPPYVTQVVKKMAVLCENSIFGVSGGDQAVKFGKEVGFDVVDYSTYDAATTRDFTGYISKYKSAGVDFLACHSRPQDGVMITRTMKELNYNPYGYGSLYGAHIIADFGDTLGRDANHVFGTTNFTSAANVPGMKELAAKFKKKHKISADATFTAGFAVLSVLQAALEINPTYNREELKKAIEKVDIKAGEYNNMQIEGIKFTPNHDNAIVKAFVVQWKDGIMHPVAPANYAVREPVWPRPTWAQIEKGA